VFVCASHSTCLNLGHRGFVRNAGICGGVSSEDQIHRATGGWRGLVFGPGSLYEGDAKIVRQCQGDFLRLAGSALDSYCLFPLAHRVSWFPVFVVYVEVPASTKKKFRARPPTKSIFYFLNLIPLSLPMGLVSGWGGVFYCRLLFFERHRPATNKIFPSTVVDDGAKQSTNRAAFWGRGKKRKKMNKGRKI